MKLQSNCQKINKLKIHLIFSLSKIMLSDSQVFIALFVALITGVLAVRLGTQLYK